MAEGVTLRVEEITVGYYADVFVLEDVSVEAQAGEITAVIGPNGAGKSTLLKTIYGFLRPRQGRIFLGEHEITGEAPFRLVSQGIAFILQDRGILPNLTVEENLELGAWLFRRNRAQVQRRIREIYRRYPILETRRRVPAGRLSGGEQRLLELGKALMTDPQVILLDEPSAGLAPKVVEELYHEVMRLKEEESRTILLVEQNVRQALQVADEVYVLELGRVKLHGPPDSVDLKAAITPWVQV